MELPGTAAFSVSVPMPCAFGTISPSTITGAPLNGVSTSRTGTVELNPVARSEIGCVVGAEPGRLTSAAPELAGIAVPATLVISSLGLLGRELHQRADRAGGSGDRELHAGAVAGVNADAAAGGRSTNRSEKAIISFNTTATNAQSAGASNTWRN